MPVAQGEKLKELILKSGDLTLVNGHMALLPVAEQQKLAEAFAEFDRHLPEFLAGNENADWALSRKHVRQVFNRLTQLVPSRLLGDRRGSSHHRRRTLFTACKRVARQRCARPT